MKEELIAILSQALHGRKILTILKRSFLKKMATIKPAVIKPMLLDASRMTEELTNLFVKAFYWRKHLSTGKRKLYELLKRIEPPPMQELVLSNKKYTSEALALFMSEALTKRQRLMHNEMRLLGQPAVIAFKHSKDAVPTSFKNFRYCPSIKLAVVLRQYKVGAEAQHTIRELSSQSSKSIRYMWRSSSTYKE